MKYYEMIDLGCGQGDSIVFARGVFGLNGSVLGIDINPAHEEKVKALGADFDCADASQVPPGKTCDVLVSSHFLEHLTSWAKVENVLMWGPRIAKDCMLFSNPMWDYEVLAKLHGRSFRWADYADHCCALTVPAVNKILLRDAELNYALFACQPHEFSDPDEPEFVYRGGRYNLSPCDCTMYSTMIGLVWRGTANARTEKAAKWLAVGTNRLIYERGMP